MKILGIIEGIEPLTLGRGGLPVIQSDLVSGFLVVG